MQRGYKISAIIDELIEIVKIMWYMPLGWPTYYIITKIKF